MKERKIIRALVKDEIDKNYSHREIEDKFGKTGQYKLGIEHLVDIILSIQLKELMLLMDE